MLPGMVLVLGFSRSGRTTLALRLANRLRAPCVDAMGWMQTHYVQPGRGPGADQVSEMLRAHLHVNPHFTENYLRQQLRGEMGVVEGLVNPIDAWFLLSNHTLLAAVDLTTRSKPASVEEESGVESIRSLLIWAEQMGQLPHFIDSADWGQDDETITRYVARMRDRACCWQSADSAGEDLFIAGQPMAHVRVKSGLGLHAQRVSIISAQVRSLLAHQPAEGHWVGSVEEGKLWCEEKLGVLRGG